MVQTGLVAVDEDFVEGFAGQRAEVVEYRLDAVVPVDVETLAAQLVDLQAGPR